MLTAMEEANLNVWFSLDLEYGLAILSIGKLPGNADDQLLTGGLTAVETLLGPEIGFEKQEGFVVDHKSSHMERVPIILGEGKKVIAQFLLMNPEKDGGVAPELIAFSKTFIEGLGESLLDSHIWQEIQIAAQILSISKIYSLIISSHENAHKKYKAKTNDKNIIPVINEKVLSSFSKFTFSDELDKLATKEYNEFIKYVKEQKPKILDQYYNDIIALVIQENPLVFLYTSPHYIHDEAKKVIAQQLDSLKEEQTVAQLNEVIEDFLTDDTLKNILQDYDIDSLKEQRDKIRGTIEQGIKERLFRKAPLIGLINLELRTKEEDFQTFINNKVIDRIFSEYDMGEILGKIAETLITRADPENKVMGSLTHEFFRNLALRFPGGLPNPLWHIMIQLFTIYAAETKQNLQKLNEIVDIPEAHWKVLREKIKAYKPALFQAFEGETGREVMQFYEGVRYAINRGFHSFYAQIIWNIEKEEFGDYINSLRYRSYEAFQSLENLYCTIKLFNILREKKFDFIDPLKIPFKQNELDKLKTQYPNELKDSVKLKDWNEQTIVTYYKLAALDLIEEEYKRFANMVDFYEKTVNEIKTFLSNAAKQKPAQLIKLKLSSLKDPSTNKFELLAKLYKDNQKDFEQIKDNIFEAKGKYEEFQNKLQEFMDKNDLKSVERLDKDKNKQFELLSKPLDKIKDKTSPINKSAYDQIQKYKEIVKVEADKAQKEADKIWEREKLKIIKATITNGRVQTFDPSSAKDLLVREGQRKFKDDSLLGAKEFLFAYSSVFLFNELDKNIERKAIEIAIFNPKSSVLVNKVLESRKDIKNDLKPFDFLEQLKAEILSAGDSMLTFSNHLANLIRKYYSAEDVPLRAFTENGTELLTAEIGPLHGSFKKWIDDGIIVHPSLILKQDNAKDIHVYYKICTIPAVGEVEYLVDAIALDAYNNTLNKISLFIESLKMTASALGEGERRKVQRLFDTLGSFLISS